MPLTFDQYGTKSRLLDPTSDAEEVQWFQATMTRICRPYRTGVVINGTRAEIIFTHAHASGSQVGRTLKIDDEVACTPASSDGVCSTPMCCAVCPDIETSGTQATLDSSSWRTVVFQKNINWITQPLHITRHHSRLLFEPSAVVTAKSGAFKGLADCLFAAYITTNLTISGYGATWRMQRSDCNSSAY